MFLEFCYSLILGLSQTKETVTKGDILNASTGVNFKESLKKLQDLFPHFDWENSSFDTIRSKISRINNRVNELKRKRNTVKLESFLSEPFELPKAQVETNQTVAINKVILKRNRDLHKQLEHETETQENLSLQIQHFETKTNVLLNLLDLTVEKQKVLYTRVKSQNTDNNALQKECDQWSEKYDKLSKTLDSTLEKLEEHKDKLRSLGIRNTNKKNQKKG